jgi:hypothetical protein
MKLLLFYGLQLVTTLPLDSGHWTRICLEYGNEIYQGGWLCAQDTHKWYRCDGTPALLADVPKELRALALLIT